ELGAHGGGLLHLLDAHVDDLELGVGDHDAVTARVARRFDDGEGLGRRGVAGTDHELLLGANLEDVAHGRQRLAVGADDLDALRAMYACADSSSSTARPNASGAQCVWKSIRPSIGLTEGGGGGKTRPWAAALFTSDARAASPAAVTAAVLKNSRRVVPSAAAG